MISKKGFFRVIICALAFAIALGGIAFVFNPVIVKAETLHDEDSVTPRWITTPVMLFNTNDVYSITDITSPQYTSPKYYSDYNNYINSECYFVYANDSVGEMRLIPKSDGTFVPMATNGSVSVRINNFINWLPINCTIVNHDRKLKDLNPDMAISGSNEKVGLGQVFYRFTPYGSSNSTSWYHTTLASLAGSEGVRILCPTANTTEIRIIYRVKEAAPNIFRPHKYYYVMAAYEFTSIS